MLNYKSKKDDIALISLRLNFQMGSMQSEEESKVVEEVETYHFGKIKIMKGSSDGTQYFKQTYDFLVDTDTQQHFIQYLK